MYQYKLEENENGYDIIINLSQDLEFAAEFKSNDKTKVDNQFQTIFNSIKSRYPKLLINSIKVMIGGILLATIPISVIGVQAQANNIVPIQQVANQTLTSPTIPTEGQAVNYTVQSGDNLWIIANRFKVSVDQIRSINILKSDVLQIGTVLKIPQTVTNTPNIPTEGQTVNYTVQSGDNLWLIANRFKVSVDQIRNSNNLKSDVLQIGTVLKIPQTVTNTPTIPTEGQTVNYTVQSGDNLSSIANQFKVSVDQIRNINILKSDVLQIGTVLKIPQTVTNTPNIPTEGQTVNYTVQSGDNLWSIANRFKVSVDQIRNINILKSDVLQIGTVLKIPQIVTNTPNIPTEGQTVNYTVQSGDNLWSIANRFKVSVDQIRNTNNLKSDVLSIGQKLSIIQPNIVNNQDSEVRDILYRVKVGDTINGIANSFNISPERIMDANNLSSQKVITNQALIIPLSNYTYDSIINPTTYVVQSGDNLWKISKQFAVSVDSIRAASNLKSDNLTIDQKLIIPTTIENTAYNQTTFEWLVEAQYNMNPTSVFHDVSVTNQEYWAKATKQQISYYANPLNFTNDETLKYQFLVLNYHSEIHYTQLDTLLKGKGVFDGHGSTFNKAASMHNVSQVYLTSHALLETGNGTTSLARGILVSDVDGKAVTPRVVYNMYGINAFDYNPNKAGAEYAYKQQWFTVEDSIIGGAKWISDNYINHPTYQQNSLYKMRWNPSSPGIHQYSTDIAWASTQTINIYQLVSTYQNVNFQFYIPTFNYI
jgi:LysM repeat protein